MARTTVAALSAELAEAKAETFELKVRLARLEAALAAAPAPQPTTAPVVALAVQAKAAAPVPMGVINTCVVDGCGAQCRSAHQNARYCVRHGEWSDRAFERFGKGSPQYRAFRAAMVSGKDVAGIRAAVAAV